MAYINAWVLDSTYAVTPAPEELIFHTWLRGIEDRPAGHCGPIHGQARRFATSTIPSTRLSTPLSRSRGDSRKCSFGTECCPKARPS